MAIYQPPKLEQVDREVLAMIEGQKALLKTYVSSAPRRWFGSLRRSTLARAIQGSNSIEGYHTSLDDAMAMIEDEPVVNERTENARAIKGYREALTYICQAAQDPYFDYSTQLLKSLHFMMIGFDLTKFPGQWRAGPVYVVNSITNEIACAAPDREMVNGLIEEVIAYLKQENGDPPIIRAAMAHLNLTMIHPFKDGNGRMARALQTLVISLGGAVHPAFSSIEEWMGGNTPEYYGVLAHVGQGKWSPGRSALPWIRFCLKAHFQQAATLLRRNEEYERLFEKIIAIAAGEKLPERVQMVMFDAALGFRITNARHRTDAGLSEVVASRDLKKLSDIGLLHPVGEKRGRYYLGADVLKFAGAGARFPRPIADPYVIVSKAKDGG